jgi:hypothetical protein
MRKLVCLLSLVLCMALSSQAQIMVDNQSGCDLKIWVVCIDLNCQVVNETPYDVNAGTTLNVPRCNPPLQTYFLIQNNDQTCPWSSGLLPTTPNPCGHIPLPSNPPGTAIPGSSCPCAPGGLSVYFTGGTLIIN